jgi:hypothetical protein
VLPTGFPRIDPVFRLEALPIERPPTDQSRSAKGTLPGIEFTVMQKSEKMDLEVSQSAQSPTERQQD